ncbi:hypothetical protein [Streptomyces tauricus]|uniref:hypothetical protein n=1 Tax=Streptomyces TaxID=1883 RepID=UPI0033BB205E
MRDSKEILDSWDAYSDEHTDLDGWPHDDDAYGLRQQRRDADTAEAFETLRTGARRLLETASKQLSGIPNALIQSRWIYQLDLLRYGLDRLDALQEDWLSTRDSLPAHARPGTPVHDTALAEHQAECWSYLDDWASHGHILSEINTTATAAPSPLPPPPTAVPAPANSRPSTARR